MGALTVGATLTGLGLTAAALDPADVAGVAADGSLTGTAVDLAAAGIGAPVPVAQVNTVPAVVPAMGLGTGTATRTGVSRTGAGSAGLRSALERGVPVRPTTVRGPAALPAGNAPALQLPAAQLPPVPPMSTVPAPALVASALNSTGLQNSPVQPVVNQLSSVGGTVVPMVRDALPPAITQPIASTGLLSAVTPITPQSAAEPTLVNAPAPLPLPALPALAPVTSATQDLPSEVTSVVHGVAGLL